MRAFPNGYEPLVPGADVERVQCKYAEYLRYTTTLRKLFPLEPPKNDVSLGVLEIPPKAVTQSKVYGHPRQAALLVFEDGTVQSVLVVGRRAAESAYFRFGTWISYAPWPASECRLHKRAVPEVLKVLQPFKNALPSSTRRTVQKREHVRTRPAVLDAEGKTLVEQRAGTEVAS